MDIVIPDQGAIMENTKIGPRTILTHEDRPVRAGLVMRESTTAPSRIKATLVIEASIGDQTGLVPLPFAQATMGTPGHKPCGWTPEFRLEMN